MRHLLATFGLSILLLPSFAFAETTSEAPSSVNSSVYSTGLSTAVRGAYSTNTPEDSLMSLIGFIVKAILSILGVIFFVLTIYSGVLWMTAGGNPDQVKKSKQILVNATMGLIITLSAYGIVNTVVDYISGYIY